MQYNSKDSKGSKKAKNCYRSYSRISFGDNSEIPHEEDMDKVDAVKKSTGPNEYFSAVDKRCWFPLSKESEYKNSSRLSNYYYGVANPNRGQLDNYLFMNKNFHLKKRFYRGTTSEPDIGDRIDDESHLSYRDLNENRNEEKMYIESQKKYIQLQLKMIQLHRKACSRPYFNRDYQNIRTCRRRSFDTCSIGNASYDRKKVQAEIKAIQLRRKDIQLQREKFEQEKEIQRTKKNFDSKRCEESLDDVIALSSTVRPNEKEKQKSNDDNVFFVINSSEKNSDEISVVSSITEMTGQASVNGRNGIGSSTNTPTATTPSTKPMSGTSCSEIAEENELNEQGSGVSKRSADVYDEKIKKIKNKKWKKLLTSFRLTKRKGKMYRKSEKNLNHTL